MMDGIYFYHKNTLSTKVTLTDFIDSYFTGLIHEIYLNNVLIACNKIAQGRMLATTERKARVLLVSTSRSCWWPVVEFIWHIISHYNIVYFVTVYRWSHFNTVTLYLRHWSFVHLTLNFDWFTSLNHRNKSFIFLKA